MYILDDLADRVESEIIDNLEDYFYLDTLKSYSEEEKEEFANNSYEEFDDYFGDSTFTDVVSSAVDAVVDSLSTEEKYEIYEELSNSIGDMIYNYLYDNTFFNIKESVCDSIANRI